GSSHSSTPSSPTDASALSLHDALPIYKYWAAALLPDTSARLKARFLAEEPGPKVRYQADYLQDPQTVAIGGTGSANARLFAGARSEEHTSELQSRVDLVCRLLLEKQKI